MPPLAPTTNFEVFYSRFRAIWLSQIICRLKSGWRVLILHSLSTVTVDRMQFNPPNEPLSFSLDGGELLDEDLAATCVATDALPTPAPADKEFDF